MIRGSVSEARRDGDGGSPVCRKLLLRFGGGALPLWILLLLLPLAGAQNSPETSEDPYHQQRFSASMAIIIVILVAALFFMGFFSIYIRHCSETRSGGSIRRAAGAALGLSRRAPRGLDQALLEKLPTFEYSAVKELKIGKDALECAVCLNEFEDDEILRFIPKCDHVFHQECIDAWFAAHVTCPVCRSNLAEPEETAEESAPMQAAESAAEPDRDGQGVDGSEINDSVHHVSVTVADDENEVQLQQPPVTVKPIQSLQQNRPPRSKSTRPRKFPRSHSTGHSLIQPGENCERFTLKLPEVVRKQIMNEALNRSMSLVALPREGSSRRGNPTAGEGSSRGKYFRLFDRLDRSGKSDRWTFSKAPPFFSRTSSLKSPRVAADGEATSSTSSRKPPLTPKVSFGATREAAGTPPADSPRRPDESPRPPV